MHSIYSAPLTFVASFLGTIAGFGTSTILIPTFTFWVPLQEALLFVGIIHLFGSIWKLVFFHTGLHWPLIAMFGIPGIAFAWLGAHIALDVPQQYMLQALGVLLITYSLYVFIHPRFTLKPTKWVAGTGGALAGFSAGIFGISGAIRSAFLTVFDLPKETFVATTGAIALAIDITRVFEYLRGGIVFTQLSWISLVISIGMSFLATYAAHAVLIYLPQRYFRFVVLTFLVLAGLKFLFWPV